jgi:WD40 repeat protein
MLLAADAQSVRSTDQSRSSLLRLLNLTSVEKYLHCHFVPGQLVAHPVKTSLVVVAGWDGSVELWDVAEHARLASARAADGELFAVAISRQGMRICVGGKSAELSIWDVVEENGISIKEWRRVRHPDGKIIRALHFLDDDSIVVASDEAVLRRYSPIDGKWTSLPAVHTAAVSVLTRDATGTKLVSGGSDSQVVSWDLNVPDFSSHRVIRCQDWQLLTTRMLSYGIFPRGNSP